MTSRPYDPDLNAKLCWELAISEIRKRGIIEGKFQPVNDDERELQRRGK